jgi:hypothetical protein
MQNDLYETILINNSKEYMKDSLQIYSHNFIFIENIKNEQIPLLELGEKS